MVKEYEAPVRTYPYPFELVVEAYHLRYPTCDLIPELLDTETIREYTSPDESLSVTERRFTMSIEAPYILKKICGIDNFFVFGQNTLNRVDRTLLIENRNETFSSKISAFETCKYSVCPDNPNHTIFQQKACMEIKNFWGFESLAEKVLIKAYTKSFPKTEKLILSFIDQLKSTGVDFVPVFEPKIPDDRRKSQPSVEEISFINPLPSHPYSIHKRDINPDKMAKIEADFILDHDVFFKRLENFSLMERNNLALLHQKFLNREESNLNLFIMLRFLRSTNGDVDLAYENLVKHINWKRKNNIVVQLQDWSIPFEIDTYWRCSWHKTDIEGSPLFVIKLGSMDIKGIIKSIGPNELAKFLIKLCEDGQKLCEEEGKRQEKLILSWSVLCDLQGLSLKHTWKPIIQIFMKLIEVLQLNYPESLSKIILTRVPKYFGLIWALISAFVAEETKKKFVLFDESSGQIEKIRNYIALENIPEFLGGTSECSIKEEYQVVPKSLYVYDDSFFSDFFDPICIENLYKKIVVQKTSTVDILMDVNNEDCLITWDFDVLEGDVVFGLFKETKSTSLTSVVNMVLSSLTLEQVPNIEPISYREGSSVQGSYYCETPGTYVLQWRNSEEMKKSVVLYYTDLLPQDHLKTSMRSLRSSLGNLSNIDTFSLKSENLSFHEPCENNVKQI